ncbi:hypothetical protein Landi51_04523 [Colletotrichum acutatum]
MLGRYEARDMDLDLSWNAPSWMPALLFDRPLNSLSSIAGRPLLATPSSLTAVCVSGTVGSGPIGLIGDLIATQPPKPTQARGPPCITTVSVLHADLPIPVVARRSAATDTATMPRAAVQKRLVITRGPAQDAARNLMLNMVMRIALACQVSIQRDTLFRETATLIRT